jgi:hypothetical protein
VCVCFHNTNLINSAQAAGISECERERERGRFELRCGLDVMEDFNSDMTFINTLAPPIEMPFFSLSLSLLLMSANLKKPLDYSHE